MKRMTYFVMALALAIGFTQCKKEQPQSGETVRITVKVNGDGEGDKATVNPANGRITFSNGDKLYVGSNGACCGCLEYSESAFSGALSPTPTTGQKLYFYFLGGNLTPTISGSTYTVNIGDQTGSTLPVISSGVSEEDYAGAGTYTTTLKNKCGLVKFATNVTSGTVSVGGMYTEASLDFSTGDITPGTTGAVSFATDGEGAGWAILLEQDAVAGAAVTATGYVAGTCDVPEVTNNMLYSTGVNVSLTPGGPSVPTGAISGLFTINADDDQVYFSRGNLQYMANTNTWRFATNQYDYIGNANGSISSTYSGWIDLFGWGTSGYSHGATCYQPWSTSGNYEDYYAYGNDAKNLYDGDGDAKGKADWGYNAISNGGNTEGQWRTLTQPEWEYVFNTRKVTVGGEQKVPYGEGVVNGVNGVILLPDNWDGSVCSGFTYGTSSWSNSFSESTTPKWSEMEAAGCVFLPAAGDRLGTSVDDVGSQGLYWSSSCYSSLNAFIVYFESGYLTTYSPYNRRCRGFSVRLVRSCQ